MLLFMEFDVTMANILTGHFFSFFQFSIFLTFHTRVSYGDNKVIQTPESVDEILLSHGRHMVLFIFKFFTN